MQNQKIMAKDDILAHIVVFNRTKQDKNQLKRFIYNFGYKIGLEVIFFPSYGLE